VESLQRPVELGLNGNAFSLWGPLFNSQEDWGKVAHIPTLFLGLKGNETQCMGSELQYINHVLQRHRPPEQLRILIIHTDQSPIFGHWDRELDTVDLDLPCLAERAEKLGLPLPLRSIKSLILHSELLVPQGSLNYIPRLLYLSQLRLLVVTAMGFARDVFQALTGQVPNLKDLRLECVDRDGYMSLKEGSVDGIALMLKRFCLANLQLDCAFQWRGLRTPLSSLSG
jgi:hypothetical protein